MSRNVIIKEGNNYLFSFFLFPASVNLLCRAQSTALHDSHSCSPSSFLDRLGWEFSAALCSLHLPGYDTAVCRETKSESFQGYHQTGAA